MILIARPRPILQGRSRALRGGSCYCSASYVRASSRSGGRPGNRYVDFGVRVCLRKRVR